MTRRHKIFVSYHHNLDQGYRNQFERMCGDRIVSRSVDIGDIDQNNSTDNVRRIIREQYLRDSTVTVVLIGKQTWQRKHVDWEISASLRATLISPRSGILGILLPSYPRPAPGKYSSSTVPPRLYDNVECKFACIYPWSTDPNEIQGWIHEAFQRKDSINPHNSRTLFGKNRSGGHWE